MPIEHKVIPECRLIVSSHIGKVTDQDCLKSYRDLYSEKTLDVTFDHLVDLTRTESDERSAEGLRDLARLTKGLFKDQKGSSKIAVIAPNALSFGLSRMYGTIAADTMGDYSVFKSADEALDWLGLPSDATVMVDIGS